DSALESQAAHSCASADRAFGGRVTAGRGPGRVECRLDVGGGHLHTARVVQDTVVALGDDRDDHVVGADAVVFGHQQFAGRVVDPAKLHGGGQEDGGFGQPPLGRGQEAG